MKGNFVFYIAVVLSQCYYFISTNSIFKSSLFSMITSDFLHGKFFQNFKYSEVC